MRAGEVEEALGEPPDAKPPRTPPVEPLEREEAVPLVERVPRNSLLVAEGEVVRAAELPPKPMIPDPPLGVPLATGRGLGLREAGRGSVLLAVKPRKPCLVALSRLTEPLAEGAGRGEAGGEEAERGGEVGRGALAALDLAGPARVPSARWGAGLRWVACSSFSHSHRRVMVAGRVGPWGTAF